MTPSEHDGEIEVWEASVMLWEKRYRIDATAVKLKHDAGSGGEA